MQEEQDYLGLTFGTAYKLLPMRKCTILQLLEEPRCDTGTERNSPEQTDFFKRSCQMSEAPLGWCTETATPHRLRGSETVSGLLRQPLLSHMPWLWFWPMVSSVRINKSKPSLLFERLGHLKYIFKVIINQPAVAIPLSVSVFLPMLWQFPHWQFLCCSSHSANQK